jgi:hypothetical protein
MLFHPLDTINFHSDSKIIIRKKVYEILAIKIYFVLEESLIFYLLILIMLLFFFEDFI